MKLNSTRSALIALSGVVSLLALGIVPAVSEAGSAHAQSGGGAPTLLASPVHAVSVVSARTVTLITGDRVQDTTYSDGHATVKLLPGSPHFAMPASAVHTERADYVVPRLPIDVRSRLDTSLFDVTALAAHRGTTVPVSVEFKPQVAPHRLAGLTLDLGSAHRATDGGTVVSGAYRASFTRPRALTGRTWQGVQQVQLSLGRARVPARGDVHTLTVDLVDADGNPVDFDEAWITNVDDAGLFNQSVDVVNGVASAKVPAGNYSVVSGDFHGVLVLKPDFPVQADRTISMSLADATVKPSESVPGYHPANTSVVLTRTAEAGGSFGESLLGEGEYDVLVQPAAASQPHGELWLEVSGAFAPRGDDGGCEPAAREGAGGGCVPLYRTLAFVEDYAPGVPDDMSFTHPREDFAIVAQHNHANGAGVNVFGDAFAVTPFDRLLFVNTEFVHIPDVRVVWLQASRTLRWFQDLPVIEPLRCCSQLGASLGTSRRYPTAGPAPAVDFARAPVGPGLEAAYDHSSTGPKCSLCRSGDRLRGSLPLFSGAGTGMSGQLLQSSMGDWTLRQGQDTVAKGSFFIRPRATLAADTLPYTLTASSHPGARTWRLSTEVTDTWWFSSGHGVSVIPLLMASYVPPTNLAGSMHAGDTSYPLHFGNLGPANSYVERARVSTSTDDGATWRPAMVTRVDRTSFQVEYVNPEPSGSEGYVSLRVSGVDRSGGSVSETAIRAYRLLPAASPSTTSAPGT